MALVFADLVRETTNTIGTGTLTLTGAVTNYQSFAAIGDGNTTYYRIISGADSEVGIGTYTSAGTTLSRTTVLYSSAGGTTKITVAAGATVICTYPAKKVVILDASGNATALGTPAAFVATNATGLPLSTGITGTLSSANGGTGVAGTLTGVLYGNGTDAYSVSTTAQLLTGMGVANTTTSGYLSSTDWNTFNGKGSGTVTGVTGTAPVVSSGGTTPAISMSAATAAVNGYMTSTYASKLDGIAAGATANTGTVTSVATSGNVNGITLTGGTITTSGTVTLGGALSGVNLTSQVTGTLPQANGGTGATSCGICRAWVNFVGSSGAVNASFNVSSVTRTGTGLYTLNFTSAISDTLYAVKGSGTWDSSAPNSIPLFGTYQGASRTTTTCQVSCNNSSSQARFDGAFLFVAIFR